MELKKNPIRLIYPRFTDISKDDGNTDISKDEGQKKICKVHKALNTQYTKDSADILQKSCHTDAKTKDTQSSIFFDCHNVESLYKKIKMIGKGSFGTVYQVKSVLDGKNYAIKIISKRKRTKTHLLNEVRVLAKLLALSTSNQNILRYYASWEQNEKLYIKTEYCIGTLDQLLNPLTKFNEKGIVFLIRQISKALEFLHSKNIVHLDIKPENIQIRNLNSENDIERLGKYHFVLGDFSLSNEIPKIKEDDYFIGEGRYLAPEVLNCNDPADIDLKKVDLFAFGRTLVEVMLNRRISIDVEHPERQLLKDVNGLKTLLSKTNYSNGLKDFVLKLNSCNPIDRMSTKLYKAKNCGFLRSSSENEKIWLKHFKSFLENRFMDQENAEEEEKQKNYSQVKKYQTC